MDSDVPEDWDAWLAAAGPGAGFGQSSAWAAMSRIASASETMVVEVRRGDARVAGVLFSIATGRGLRGRLRGAAATAFDGPVLTAQDPLEALAHLLDAVAAEARARGVRRLRFTSPSVRATWIDDPAVDATFAKRGYTTIPWSTALVELVDDEELLHRFDKSARKSVRRALESDVEVTRCRDIDEYCSCFRPAYLAGRHAAGLVGLPAGDVEAMRRAIGVTHEFFVARAGEVALATLGSYRFNGVATEITSTLTPDGRSCSIAAQDLLHWELFRHHRAAGDTWFDLAGFRPEGGSDKETGIRRYKTKWGGAVIAVPQRERG